MIPKIIHYCWLSGDPYPELIAKCIHSWNLYLNGYQLILWDLKRIETIDSIWLKQTIALKKYAFAADFIRIYALFQYGGVYLDADVELVASMDPFLYHDFFIGVEYTNDLEPAVFGAVASHPWLTDLLAYYQNRSFIKTNGKQDIKPLPTIINESAIRRFGFQPNSRIQFINKENITIYPSEFFSPKNIYSSTIKKTPRTVAIHHFNGNWVKKNTKYNLKMIFHRLLFRLGGKSFHRNFIQIIRKINR